MQMVYVPAVQAPSFPGLGDAIAADECYVELYVESCQLVEARKFSTRFNGVVCSFVSLSREAALS